MCEALKCILVFQNLKCISQDPTTMSFNMGTEVSMLNRPNVKTKSGTLHIFSNAFYITPMEFCKNHTIIKLSVYV